MKKIFLLSFLSLTLVVTGQVATSGTIHMTKAIPVKGGPFVCTGDSILIGFKFTPSGQDTPGPEWFLHFTSAPFTFQAVRTFSMSEIYSMTKTLSGADTIYSFKYRVPANFSAMDPTGDIILEFNAGNDSYHPGKTVNIQKCTTTGIEENTLNLSEVIYYDLLGNRTDKRAGEVLIEQRGSVRRKILILE